jgi:AraC-like DNA-binding protein
MLLERPPGGARHVITACGISGGLLDGRHTLARIDDPGHPGYRWLLVLEGSGRARDDFGAEHVLVPGTLLIRAAGKPHRVERARDGRWLEWYLRIPEKLSHGLAEVGVIDPRARCWRPADLPALHAAIGRWMVLAARCRDSAATAALVGATAALITQAQADAAPPLDQRCRRLRDALDRDLGARCAIEGLLRDLGDPDTVRAAFRARFGCTPREYRLRRRIAAAEALLREGARAGEVAARLGWPDASAFGRQFRAAVGCTPGRWRRT